MGDAPTASPDAGARLSYAGRLAAYFRKLWRGEFPLGSVFWTDMIIIGSVVNVVGSTVAMLLFVTGAPIALGVFVHFAPIPYNILLFFAVWQAAAREASRWSFAAQAVGVVWLVISIVL